MAARGDTDPGRGLRPRPLDAESYAETFTAVADLEDGTYIHLQLAISNLGVGDRKGGCRALVVTPGREPWEDSVRVSSSQWSFVPRPVPMLRVAQCFLASYPPSTSAQPGPARALGSSRFRVSLDSGVVDLRLLRSAAPLPQTRYQVDVGEKLYETTVLIPWAAVEATVEGPADGRQPAAPARTLRGFGYIDHARSTTLPAEVARGWVRFRALNDGRSVLMLARLLPDEDGVEGYLWQQGAPGPVRLTGVSIVPRPAAGTETPFCRNDQAWHVEAQVPSGSFEMLTRCLLFRYAPVERLGVFGSVAVAMLGNPVTRTFRARLEAGADSQQPSGILEINHVDE